VSADDVELADGGKPDEDAWTPADRAVASPPSESACPRCGGFDAGRRFYGPCASCREELGATLRREAGAVVSAGYVPKMNVVPNQVATKE
jgi:hypothetical protein